MSVLAGASNVQITGGAWTIHQGGQTRASDALNKLAAHTAHAALYNSAARFDAPRCHRNTRASYLDGLEQWMLGQGEDYDGARLIWLTGGAGAGKSAIIQSIAERAAKHQLMLGSFFFICTDTSRNYAEVLIPTLAYQLTSAFPDSATVIDPILDRNPLIFKASLQKQAEDLLVRPLQHLVSAGIIDATSASRMLFIVDGLDQCEDPREQALIIKVIADILCDHDLPVSFLVASRSEVVISQAIQAEKRIHSILATITLDKPSEATSDIRQFIEDSFLDIRETHPLREHISENWPHPDSVDRLVKKSSGHFIYAAWAMKFILSGDEHPERALRVIEGLEPSRTGNPFAELDMLFEHTINPFREGYSADTTAFPEEMSPDQSDAATETGQPQEVFSTSATDKNGPHSRFASPDHDIPHLQSPGGGQVHMFNNANQVQAFDCQFHNVAHIRQSAPPSCIAAMSLGLQAASLATTWHSSYRRSASSLPLAPPVITNTVAPYSHYLYRDIPLALGPLSLWIYIIVWLRRGTTGHQ